MVAFIQTHQGPIAFLAGLMFFILLASRFNHAKLRHVNDQSVAVLCITVSALCGLVVSSFVYLIITLFF
ncbi:MAG: hypothetical protein IH614_17660 [Desulfuromonadales bacterium]|nr:hypothetical protein [Desulfuromonadales bacterium]